MLNDAARGATRSTVFIVDDHPIVRQGLALLINREPDLTVCGDAEEAGVALRRIEELKPDLIVVDISLSRARWLGSAQEHSGAMRNCRC